MTFFPPPISFYSQLQLGILRRYQGEILEKILKIVFPLFVPITIIRTQKMWDSRKHIPFHSLVISIGIYLLTTKIKFHEEI